MKAPGKMNFLIVDDMDNMRRSIRAMLKLINFGREFFEAANGREAWKFLEEEKAAVDFIISDYHMPVMSGTELLNRVRNDQDLRNIPFLMITAEANQDVVAEAAENDVDAYMTKPFVTATLEQKIKELLHNAHNPNPLTLHLRKARDLEEEGEIDGAINEAKKALLSNKQSSRPFRELGRLFMKKGELKNALLSFRQATDINRLDVPSYHFLGQIYYQMGDLDKALENYARAMQISPRHGDRALDFAKLLLEQDKMQEAEKVLKFLLRNVPPDLAFREDVADLCLNHDLFDLAARIYRGILKEDKERHGIRKKLGICLHRNGYNEEAVRVLTKALGQHREDIEIMLTMARCYLETGMTIRADNMAARVIRMDPENQEAKDILVKCS